MVGIALQCLPRSLTLQRSAKRDFPSVHPQCVTDLHDCLSLRREEQLGPEGAAGAHPHPQDVQDAVVVLDRAHHGRHEHRQRHGRALQPAAVAHRRAL